jgi:hypothetical protein
MKKRFAGIVTLTIGKKYIDLKINKEGIIEIKENKKEKKESDLKKWLK